MRRLAGSLLCLWLATSPCVHAGGPSVPTDWPVTEGRAGGGRYSSLTEIHRGNVDQLEVAWTYRHGDYKRSWFPWDQSSKGSAFQATPLLVEGRLIFPTPFNRVIALDPATGRELWSFDPELDTGRRFANMLISRGVAYWKGPEANGACASRIFSATLDARLIALDTKTGKPCADFGAQGTLNLLDGIEGLVDPWEYNVNFAHCYTALRGLRVGWEPRAIFAAGSAAEETRGWSPHPARPRGVRGSLLLVHRAGRTLLRPSPSGSSPEASREPRGVAGSGDPRG